MEAPLAGGRYLIRKSISKNQGTRIGLADDQKLHGRQVLLAQVPDDPAGATDFQILSQLNHPGVAAFLDWVDSAEGQSVAVLSFVEGETLEAMLSRGAVNSRKAEALLQQITETTQAMRNAGISLRPLSADEIIVKPDGRSIVVGIGTEISELRRQLRDAGNSVRKRNRNILLCCAGALVALLLMMIRFPRMEAPARLTHGHLFVPNIELSAIQQVDPVRRTVVRTMRLPDPYSFYYPTPSLVIRESDGSIIVTALDRMDRSVVLVIDAAGRIRARKEAPVMLLQQLATDSSDPSGATILGISPYSGTVAAINPYQAKYEERLMIPGSFPSGLVAGADGQFIVLDHRSGEVQRYSANGTLNKVIATVEPDTCFQMTMSAGGTLLVAQRRRNRILNITADGAVQSWSNPDFRGPISVLAGAADHSIYVGNAESSDLVVISDQGTAIGSINMGGIGIGQGAIAP